MDTIKLLLTNMSNSLTSKIYETKDNYVSEIKQLLKSSDSENNIMIRTLIDKYNEETFQKINDILPTSLNNLSENIFNNFKKELNICFDKSVSLILVFKSVLIASLINFWVIATEDCEYLLSVI